MVHCIGLVWFGKWWNSQNSGCAVCNASVHIEDRGRTLKQLFLKFAVSGKCQRGGHLSLSLCFYLLTFLFRYFLSSNKCTFGVPNPMCLILQYRANEGRVGEEELQSHFPFPPTKPTRPPKALIPHCHTFVWANCNLRWMDLLWFENYFVIYFFHEYHHKYPSDIRLFQCLNLSFNCAMTTRVTI